MAASCAVCLTPIIGGAFVLHGTEVVHKVCIRGLAQTRAIKLEAAVAQLRTRTQADQIELARLRLDYETTLTRVGEQVAELQRKLRDKQSEIEQEKGWIKEWRDRANRAERSATTIPDSVAAEIEQLRARVDALTIERDAARREAQLHQTIQGARPTRSPDVFPSADVFPSPRRPPTTPAAPPQQRPPPPPPPDPEPALDDSEARFSLLELDLPK